MKTKLISKKSRLIILSVLLTNIMFHGCENHEDILDLYPTYLDVDVSSDIASAENAAIYEEAINRMDQHIKVQKGKYVTKLLSGKDLNISEDLFQLLNQQLINTNSVISNGDFKYNRKKKAFYITSEMPISEITRIKKSTMEDPGFDYVGFDIGFDWHWYGVDVVLSHQVFKSIVAGGAISAIAIADLTKIVGTVVIAATYLYDEFCNGKGIKIKVRPYPVFPAYECN